MNEKTYGTCGSCGRDYTLKKDGTLHWHGDGVAFPAMGCRGIGQKPIKVFPPRTPLSNDSEGK
jgi:hypothetical protein